MTRDSRGRYAQTPASLALECQCEAMAQVEQAIATLETALRWMRTANQTLTGSNRAA